MRTLWIALLALALAVAALAWWLGATPAHDSQPALASPSLRVESAASPAEPLIEHADVAAPSSKLLERDALAPSVEQRARDEREARARTTVVGRLVDSTGNAVPDVRVLFASAESGPELPLDARAWQAPERKLGETQSDAEGRFTINPAPIGALRLALRSSEKAPRDIDGVFVGSGQTTDLGEIELLPGLVLAGRVLSAEGAPVEGAWLIRPDSSTRPSLGDFPGERGVVLGQSAADGSFELAPQPVGPWTILVHSSEHPDFIASSAGRMKWRDETRLELRFPPSSTIEGRVVLTPGPNAPALSDLEVRASALDEPGVDRGPVKNSTRRATLGPHGEFTLAGIEPEALVRLRLAASEKDSRNQDWTYETELDVRGGERDVLLQVGAVSTIVVHARNAVTGAPMTEFRANAQVRRPDGVLRGLSLRSEKRADGGLLLRTDRTIESGGLVVLTLRAEGYFSTSAPDFELRPGASVELAAVELAPQPRLDFHVSDALTGRPLSGARVVVSLGDAALESASAPRERSREIFESRSDLTDPSGMTRLWSEREGCGWATARLEGYASSEPLEVCFKAAVETIEIALAIGPALQVRVLDAHGAPAPSRRVILHRDASVDVSRIEAQRFFERDALSDSEGLARFEGLTPGAYRAWLVERRVGAARTADEHARTFASTVVAPDVEAQLELRALPRGSLSGRVSFARSPLANAVVMLSVANSKHPRARNPEGVLRTRTDSEGRYLFEQLGPGGWNLSVFHADLLVPTRMELSYDGDEHTFDIVIPRTALVGRVVDTKGNPIEGARISVGRWQPNARTRGRPASPFQRIDSPSIPATDADGRFTILGAPAERIAIEVSHSRHQTHQTKPFTPEVGVERDLGDLVLDAAASVRVSLVRWDRPETRPRLILRRLDGPKNADGGREVRVQTLDSRGRATATGLAPGRWRVEIDLRIEGQARPRVDLKLQGHEVRAVELEPS